MELSSLTLKKNEMLNIINELKQLSNCLVVENWYLSNEKLLLDIMDSFKSFESEFTIELLNSLLKNLLQNCPLKFGKTPKSLLSMDQIIPLFLKFLIDTCEIKKLEKEKGTEKEKEKEKETEPELENTSNNKEKKLPCKLNSKTFLNNFNIFFNWEKKEFSVSCKLQNKGILIKINLLNFIRCKLIDFIQNNNYIILESLDNIDFFTSIEDGTLNIEMENYTNFLKILKQQIKNYKDLFMQYIKGKLEEGKINIETITKMNISSGSKIILPKEEPGPIYEIKKVSLMTSESNANININGETLKLLKIFEKIFESIPFLIIYQLNSTSRLKDVSSKEIFEFLFLSNDFQSIYKTKLSEKLIEPNFLTIHSMIIEYFEKGYLLILEKLIDDKEKIVCSNPFLRMDSETKNLKNLKNIEDPSSSFLTVNELIKLIENKAVEINLKLAELMNENSDLRIKIFEKILLWIMNEFKFKIGPTSMNGNISFNESISRFLKWSTAKRLQNIDSDAKDYVLNLTIITSNISDFIKETGYQIYKLNEKEIKEISIIVSENFNLYLQMKNKELKKSQPISMEETNSIHQSNVLPSLDDKNLILVNESPIKSKLTNSDIKFQLKSYDMLTTKELDSNKNQLPVLNNNSSKKKFDETENQVSKTDEGIINQIRYSTREMIHLKKKSEISEFKKSCDSIIHSLKRHIYEYIDLKTIHSDSRLTFEVDKIISFLESEIQIFEKKIISKRHEHQIEIPQAIVELFVKYSGASSINFENNIDLRSFEQFIHDFGFPFDKIDLLSEIANRYAKKCIQILEDKIKQLSLAITDNESKLHDLSKNKFVQYHNDRDSDAENIKRKNKKAKKSTLSNQIKIINSPENPIDEGVIELNQLINNKELLEKDLKQQKERKAVDFLNDIYNYIIVNISLSQKSLKSNKSLDSLILSSNAIGETSKIKKKIPKEIINNMKKFFLTPSKPPLQAVDNRSAKIDKMLSKITKISNVSKVNEVPNAIGYSVNQEPRRKQGKISFNELTTVQGMIRGSKFNINNKTIEEELKTRALINKITKKNSDIMTFKKSIQDEKTDLNELINFEKRNNLNQPKIKIGSIFQAHTDAKSVELPLLNK